MPAVSFRKIPTKEDTMIPMSSDVAALVGEFAEDVDNRSLLYEKFPLPKWWGHPEKTHDAARWSVLRICAEGSIQLQDDAARLRSESSRKAYQGRIDVAEGLDRCASLADSMAQV